MAGPFRDARFPLLPVGNPLGAPDTSTVKYGSGSMLFPKVAGQQVNIPHFERFGSSGDFTAECWVYPRENASQHIFACGASVSSESRPAVYRTVAGGFSLATSNTARVTSGAYAANAWHHVAITRASGVMTLWVNGGSAGTYSNSATLAAEDHCLGANGAGALLNGNIYGYRFTDGVARYTSGFTPPTAAFPTDGSGDSHWSSVLTLVPGDETLVPDAGYVQAAVTIPAFPPAWPAGVREAPGAERLRRVDYGGFGQIVGTVKRVNTPANTPLRRRVRLIRDRDGVCVGETWSDATTGAYAFAGFDPAERYSVVSYDHAHVFRAVIADHLLPEVWP